MVSNSITYLPLEEQKDKRWDEPLFSEGQITNRNVNGSTEITYLCRDLKSKNGQTNAVQVSTNITYQTLEEMNKNNQINIVESDKMIYTLNE